MPTRSVSKHSVTIPIIVYHFLKIKSIVFLHIIFTQYTSFICYFQTLYTILHIFLHLMVKSPVFVGDF